MSQFEDFEGLGQEVGGDVSSVSSRGRGRGRRGCGRRGGGRRGAGGRGAEGRGRGIKASHSDKQNLEVVRQQKQLNQRRLKLLLNIDVQKEFIARKREAQLERMLLPDAPARKRKAKRPSPERRPCIFTDAAAAFSLGSGQEQGEASQASASTSTHTHTLEFHHTVVSEEASTSTSAISRPIESVPVEMSADIGAEVEAGSLTARQISTAAIGVSDIHNSTAITDWLTNVIDSDDDINNIDDDYASSVSKLTEPACDTDMTLQQAQVLQVEDDINDRALRNIVADDTESYTFNWTSDSTTFLGRRESFTETYGPTFTVTDDTKAIDVFDKMFDIDFIDRLCTETNRYASQKMALLVEQDKLTTTFRSRRWTPTDRDEMISFLAVHILQGLYPLTDEQYFGFNGYGTVPHFSRIMSYNRYVLLKTLLHFVDNQTLTDTTRLAKIRPIVDYFNDKFPSLYMPSQEIVVDEFLLKWRGRLSFAQKISSKAAQVGIKTYELSESSSGYLWKFFVYAGKDNPTNGDNDVPITQPDNDDTNDVSTDGATATGDDANRPTNATAKIVFDLIEPLLDRGHTLIMDNFYNSPLLLRCLKKRKTDCYGTLRLNREFVPESVKTITKTELRQGEVVTTYCSDLSILVWRDANIVSLISTYHNLQIGASDKNNKVTSKPNIVLDYNKYMGGVDGKDQYLSAHPMERLQNRLWYKKLFRHLCNTAIFNCFVIFSTKHRKISHRQFRITLAEDLLKRHKRLDLTTEPRLLNSRTSVTEQSKTTKRTSLTSWPKPLVDSNHFPARTGSRSTVCRMCESRTAWKCEECNVNLCIDRCLKAYHKP